MTRLRLDQEMVRRGLAKTRSQAENLINLGFISIDGKIIKKAGYFIFNYQKINLIKKQTYVSRAGYKLEAANHEFKVNFNGKVVLDCGSSTGGFTDYAAQKKAKKIIAVEVGTKQLNPLLRQNSKVELHEKTDIRDFEPKTTPDIVLVDLSFISLRLVLGHLAKISGPNTQILVLFKPQFEAKREQINKGIIKNSQIRRQIIREFESWVQKLFKILGKVDSRVPGEHGNLERFYYLQKIK